MNKNNTKNDLSMNKLSLLITRTYKVQLFEATTWAIANIERKSVSISSSISRLNFFTDGFRGIATYDEIHKTMSFKVKRPQVRIISIGRITFNRSYYYLYRKPQKYVNWFEPSRSQCRHRRFERIFLRYVPMTSYGMPISLRMLAPQRSAFPFLSKRIVL